MKTTSHLPTTGRNCFLIRMIIMYFSPRSELLLFDGQPLLYGGPHDQLPALRLRPWAQAHAGSQALQSQVPYDGLQRLPSRLQHRVPLAGM